MIMTNDFRWEADVRDYEVDYQGIVNNANYFHYFDHARAVYLKNVLNVDVRECAEQGINIVLIKTEIFFRSPLKYGDSFYVSSQLSAESLFKLKFIQEIFVSEKNIIAAKSESLIAAIKNGKPFALSQFNSLK